VLGRFLEFSIPTPDIQASLDFYGRLGFSQAEVGETWPHPYAVVTDGRLCLGLHQAALPAPSMTFVKPDLLKHLEAFERLGVQFEFRHLGNDVFNEVGWFDPAGHLIRLIEARTFSPSKRLGTESSLCGYFLEIALPQSDSAAAKQYWEQFGFVGMDEPEAPLPHVSCTSDTVDVGLYDPAHLKRSTLLFDTADVRGALARLGERGIEPAGQVPAPLGQLAGALLMSPEGTPILLSRGLGN
jgi:catechol 2,3-dioxygenase-like lactoylglutathione lyase family enzyme